MMVYISASYSTGDISENLRRVCFAADEVYRKGHIPFIPHLSQLWHLISPKKWQDWIRMDLAILERCDALLRLESESSEANIEVEKARSLCMFIYNALEEIPEICNPNP